MKRLFKVNEEEIFESPRMKAVKVTYADKRGNEVLTHTVIRSNPSVAILVFDERKRVALIQQFRSATGQIYVELPAGVINPGETEEEAAARETLEETGLIVKEVHSLVKGPSVLDPSKSDENYGVAVATVEARSSPKLDDEEQIDSKIIWIEEKEVFERVKAQMFKGEPFNEGLFMSGHSLYAIMAYMMSKM